MSTQAAPEFVPEWTDGDKLRKVRRYLGLTQEEFAERLAVNASTYMAWEADRNHIKNLKAIARRIKQLSGTPLWWWFDTEPPHPPDDAPRISGVDKYSPGDDGPQRSKPTGLPRAWRLLPHVA